MGNFIIGLSLRYNLNLKVAILIILAMELSALVATFVDF